jgi:hypothetical protein
LCSCAYIAFSCTSIRSIEHRRYVCCYFDPHWLFRNKGFSILL